MREKRILAMLVVVAALLLSAPAALAGAIVEHEANGNLVIDLDAIGPIVAKAQRAASQYANAYVIASKSDSDPDHDSPRVKKIVIKTSAGFLGVGVADVDSDRARSLNLRDDYGVEVTNVVEGSGAANAGIRKGDVILEYNGQRVEGTRQFVRMVRETPAGRTAKIQLSRDGKSQTVTATLGKPQTHVFRYFSNDNEGDNDNDADTEVEIPEPPEPPEPPEAPEEHGDHEMFEFNFPDVGSWSIPDIPMGSMSWRTARLGVEIEPIGGQLAEYFGVKNGILVRSVLKNSAAEKAGLKAGDVIVKVDGESISRTGDIGRTLRSKKSGDNAQVTFVRNGKERSLDVKLQGPSAHSGHEPLLKKYKEKEKSKSYQDSDDDDDQ